MVDKGDVFVISAPSGAGKTTIINKFMETHKNDFMLSVSVTTRPARTGEKHGTHYYFFSKEKFLEYIKKGKFIEYAKIINEYYGTLKETVKSSTASGRNLIMDIDVQGAKKIKKQIKKCVTVFMMPPSFEELTDRLTKRKTDSPEAVKKRLALAKKEMKQSGKYDFVIVNRDIDETVGLLEAILKLTKFKKYKV